MNREEVIKWGEENGWKLDQYGHLKQEFGRTLIRIKLQAHSVRFEKRGYNWKSMGENVRYYKDLDEKTLFDFDRFCDHYYSI